MEDDNRPMYDKNFNYSQDYGVSVQTGKTFKGKPIYRAIFTDGLYNVKNFLEKWLGYVDTLISFCGTAKDIYAHTWPIPNFFKDDTNYNITLNMDSDTGKMNIDFGSYFDNGSEVVLIIEYTKR